MTDARSSTFGATVKAWTLEGWAQDALLPKMPDQKRPGRWLEHEKRWVGLQGHILKEGLAGAKDPTTWREVQAWPWEGLCVRGTYYPGLDIDCEHQVAVHEVLKAAEAFAGQQLPWRGRASSQRLLAPFEASTPGSIAAWRPVRFRMPNGMVGMVELKAHGTQWIAAGKHPDGQDYRWLPDEIPDAMGGLPSLRDQAHADELREAVVDALERAGAELMPTGPGGPSGGQPGAYQDPDGHDALVPLEALQGALRATPCDAEIMPNHDEAVRVMAGLRWLLGREGQSIPDFVMEWLLSYPGAGDEWIQQRWDSFYSIAPSGAAFLDALARCCADRGAYRAVQSAVDGHKVRDIFDDGAVDEEDIESVREGPAQAQGEAPAAGDPAGEDNGAARELARLRRSVVHFYAEGEFIELDTGLRMSKDAFNDSPKGVEISRLDLMLQQGDRPKRRPASVVLTQEGELARIHAITYLPGKGRFTTMRTDQGMELQVMNLWRAPEVHEGRVTDAQVEPFLAVVRQVLPRLEDQILFLSWLAYIAQNPGKKINWALVLKSETHGAGKDTLLSAVQHVVGPRNMSSVEPSEFDKTIFNAKWAMSQVVLIPELSSFHKRDLYDKLKSLVASTATGAITVNVKNRESFDIPNLHVWVMTTNKADALMLEPTDRRFAVLGMREEVLPQGIASAYHDWREEHGPLLAAWMRQYRISEDFNPWRCPATTEAKVEMMRAGVPREAEELMEFITEGPWADRETITLTEARLVAERDGMKLGRKVLRLVLEKAGFVLPKQRDEKGRVNVGRAKRSVLVRHFPGSEKSLLAADVTHTRIAQVLLQEQRRYGSAEAEETEELLSPKVVTN